MEATAITLPEFQRLLEKTRGPQFVTFVARTDARLRKRNNPLGPALKIARVNGVIGWNYGLTVRRQQVREGNEATFQPLSRSWGSRVQVQRDLPAKKPKRLPGLVPLFAHNGKLYLEVKVERVLETRYVSLAGEPLTAEQVEPFLRKRNSNAAHQGLTREVVLRDYQLDTIESITLGGRTLVVRKS